MPGYDVKDFQLNDETIKYIIIKSIITFIGIDITMKMEMKKHIVLPIQMVIDFTLILLVCKYFTTIMRIRISLQRRNFWKSKIFF
ncbi:hypothetical protein UQ06_27960 [Escherichia coli]|nr:hypothetical protein UQ06_27960 [Escherichia coli]